MNPFQAFKEALQEHNGPGRTPVRITLPAHVLQMSAAELRIEIDRERAVTAQRERQAADDRIYRAAHGGQSRIDRERRLNATSLGRQILQRERTGR